MTKRKTFSFVLMLAVVLAMLIGMMLPGMAQAEIIPDSADWAGYVYKGYDPYFDEDVVAYREGATASIDFVWFNNKGEQVTIIEPFVYLDWGAKFVGTGPTIVANNMPETFGIDFAAPTAADAGAVAHGYFITVGYQENSGNYWVNTATWVTPFGAINGVNVDFGLPNSPVVRSSLKVWQRDSGDTEWQLQTVDVDYDFTDIMAYDGDFTMDTAPQVGDELRVSYEYYENLGTGDGYLKRFWVGDTPVVDATLSVFLDDWSAGTVTAVTDFTFDRMEGVVTLGTAPQPYQDVLVRYQYYDLESFYDSSGVGYLFAVYTADQADARVLWQRYLEARDSVQFPGLLSGSALQKWGEAEAARSAGDIQYREGDFAGAKVSYQAAVDAMAASIAAEATLYSTVETGLMGLLTGAGGAIDAYGNKLQAEADNLNGLTEAQANKLNAQAGMTNTIGIFMILIGVALIFASVASILWAFSRYVAAKGPKQAQV